MGLFRKKQDPISARQKQLNAEIAALEVQIQQLHLEKEKPAPPAPANFSGSAGAKGKGSPFATPDAPSAPVAPVDPSPSNGSATSGFVPSRSGSVPSQPPQPSPQLRLRSTAVPHGSLTSGAAQATSSPLASATPVFEEVDQDRLQAPPEEAAPGHYNDLGVRKYDLASGWQRLKNHFRGPVTSNPKLVHYLSAGSIQGLRPLRYEKRVARNRVIVLAAFLVLALWGVIAIFFSRH